MLLCRPFRADGVSTHGSQGVALGYWILPLWGHNALKVSAILDCPLYR